MGAFGIYALVVTFIFVIYYVVMICLDLFGTKGVKKDNVEVIHTGEPVNNMEALPVVATTKIREVGEGKYQIDRDGEEPEIYGEQEEITQSKEKAESVLASAVEQSPLSAEDIVNADNEELAREAQTKIDSLEEQLTPVSPKIQGAVYVDEFKEDYTAALLKGRIEDEQAEQLSF